MKDCCKDYKKFFNTCPVGLYKTKLENGLIININPFGAKMLGYSKPEEVINKVNSTKHYDFKLRSLLIKELKENNSVTDFEIEMIKKDGNSIWVSATAMIEGEYIIGSLTDITQRKFMENEIENLKFKQVNMLKEISIDAKQRVQALEKAI